MKLLRINACSIKLHITNLMCINLLCVDTFIVGGIAAKCVLIHYRI